MPATYLYSKAISVTLKLQYACVLFSQETTRDASYILMIGLGMQSVCLTAIWANQCLNRDGYSEIASV